MAARRRSSPGSTERDGESPPQTARHHHRRHPTTSRTHTIGFDYSPTARGPSESETLAYDTWNTLRAAATDLLDPGDQRNVYKITETSQTGVGSPL